MKSFILALVLVIMGLSGLSNVALAGGGVLGPAFPITTGHSVMTPFSHKFCPTQLAVCDIFYGVYLGQKDATSVYVAKITAGNNFGLGLRYNQVVVSENSYLGGEKSILTLRTSWYYLSSIIANDRFMVVTGSMVRGYEGFQVYATSDWSDPKVTPANPKLVYTNPLVSSFGNNSDFVSVVYLTDTGRILFATNMFEKTVGQPEFAGFRGSVLKEYWITQTGNQVLEGKSTSFSWFIDTVDTIWETGDFVLSGIDMTTGGDRFAYIIEKDGSTRVIDR